MVAVKPALARAFGNDSWVWAVAIADLDAPTLAEVTALTAFDMSCTLFREQEGIVANTETVTLPALLCETENYESKGATTYGMSDLSVAFRPQDAAGEDGKLAWEAMDDMAEGFLVRRQGIRSTDAWAAGQFVDVFPAQLGVKVPGKTGTGADAAYNFTVAVSVTGQASFNVALVA